MAVISYIDNGICADVWHLWAYTEGNPLEGFQGSGFSQPCLEELFSMVMAGLWFFLAVYREQS